eukprot:COSAG02_NODE_2296_length_9197_cov_11.568587_2_plen_181_part_00
MSRQPTSQSVYEQDCVYTVRRLGEKNCINPSGLSPLRTAGIPRYHSSHSSVKTRSPCSSGTEKGPQCLRKSLRTAVPVQYIEFRWTAGKCGKMSGFGHYAYTTVVLVLRAHRTSVFPNIWTRWAGDSSPKRAHCTCFGISLISSLPPICLEELSRDRLGGNFPVESHYSKHVQCARFGGV